MFVFPVLRRIRTRNTRKCKTKQIDIDNINLLQSVTCENARELIYNLCDARYDECSKKMIEIQCANQNTGEIF